MPENDAQIETALQAVGRRAAGYQLYTDYYHGRQRLAFATEKFLSAFGNLFRAFAVNHCRSVVSATADRLEIEGFAPLGVDLKERRRQRGEGSFSRDAGDDAWDIWTWNRMDQDAGEVHLEALRTGDAYVIVWPTPDTGDVTLYPQKAASCHVEYDPERPGKALWAAKVWEAEKRWRLNLYWSDRIEKYVTRNSGEGVFTDRPSAGGLPEKASAFVPFDVPGEPWPLANPWEQVPVFHFANDAPLGSMGGSDLHDVLPLQDALNKSVCDLIVGMEFVALPQRWATGLEIEIDPATQKPIPPFRPGVDKLWVAGNPRGEDGTVEGEVRFGQFPEANLPQLLQVQDSFRLEIARISGTPLHYMFLITNPPSGEALRALETRSIKKARDRQGNFGWTWAAVMELALKMKGQSGVRLVTEWADPAPRSDREKAEGVQMLTGAGASLEGAAKVSGYDEVQARELGMGAKVSASEPEVVLA